MGKPDTPLGRIYRTSAIQEDARVARWRPRAQKNRSGVFGIFRWKEPSRGRTEIHQRRLSEVRRLTRELIKTANGSGRSGVDCETTSRQDLDDVRALKRARHQLLHAMQMALSAGLHYDDIRAQGIDQTASEATIMSDLAHYMLDAVRG